MDNKLCRHFGECGGCKLQDLDYKKQLSIKQSSLFDISPREAIRSKIQPIKGSPEIYFYRNKMEFSFSQNNGRIVCGLHHSLQKRRVVDIQECTIFSEDAPLILGALKEIFRKSGLTCHSTFSHRGFLRHLVLREAKNTEDLMVNIVTSSENILDKETIKISLLNLGLKKRVVSLVWTVNDAFSDVVIPQKREIFHGRDYIEEKIHNFTFKILPYSFFQVNPYILDDFYTELKDLLNLKGKEKILDLFSGAGTISIILANSCDFIWAIEQSQQAVENAYSNLALNNIKNITFLSGDARKVLYSNLQLWKDNIDIVIINPPRGGVAKKIIQRVKAINPEKIVYSSCNPKTFSQDIRGFLDSYDIEIIQPFDFFPHTPHVELLSLLVRK
ncbi:MAG: 23S rRNA (uracil(1939)-C(5))-methyltransferase RlmD [Candidatus Omnitrophica bacterium]|nr:23S rRNA (uracil(1939)-C(5))-methyltransferase RlmD [Candidatus Omnitrophota bacterium]